MEAPNLNHCIFHECVSFSNWDESKGIEFFIPDGQFVLLNYNIMDSFEAPFQIDTRLEESNFPGKLDIIIKVINFLSQLSKARF